MVPSIFLQKPGHVIHDLFYYGIYCPHMSSCLGCAALGASGNKPESLQHCMNQLKLRRLKVFATLFGNGMQDFESMM